MTKTLREAQLTDSLPEIVGKQPWATALSFAISNLNHRLLDIADATHSFSAVENIERHDVLDALAVDLQISQYDEAYDIPTKQKLVKYALQYWATAGTKQATETVLKTILKDGWITEWYQYGGRPGYFKIHITNNSITGQQINEFKQVAENVKRLSAWLDKIVLDMVNDTWTQRVGFIVHNVESTTTKQKRDPNQFYGFILHDAATVTTIQER